MKELLKKLKYYKYPYIIKISLDTLNKEIDVINVEKSDNDVVCNTNKKTINFLNDNNIQYELLNKRKYFKYFIFKKWIMIVSLLMIILIMFTSNTLIRKISFKSKGFYNEEVYEFVIDHLYKVGNCYILKDDLNQLNKEIRTTFNYYEFINVSKENSNLIINIVKNAKNYDDSESFITNELVSSKNAYVLKINISSGIRNVDLFQMVKKGDLLISGENVSGNVVARCIEIKEYTIPKKYKRKVYTNNYFVNRYIKFNNHNKIEKAPYKLYYKFVNIIYELGNFSLVEETYFEQVELDIEYDISEIEEYAKEYIKYLFYKNHHYEDEKIIDIKILDKREDNNYLYIKSVNTTIEQIAIEKND